MILTFPMVGADSYQLAPSITVTDAAAAAIIIAALQAASAATNPIAYVTSVIAGYGAPTHTSLYKNADDVALLTFRSLVAGGSAQLVIPAPLDSMFMTDTETVDPTSPVASAIIAAVLANCDTPSGNGLTAYVGGQRKKFTRR